jgi:ubiquitin C-terminal hydrolase
MVLFYSQHDAHEFLIYLLEGLNEELNRIQEKKKRYIDCSNEVETIRYCLTD